MNTYDHTLRDVEGAVSPLVQEFWPVDLQDTRLARKYTADQLWARAPKLRQLRHLVVPFQCTHAYCPSRALLCFCALKLALFMNGSRSASS